MEDLGGLSMKDSDQDDEGICRNEIVITLLCLHFDPILFLICLSLVFIGANQ